MCAPRVKNAAAASHLQQKKAASEINISQQRSYVTRLGMGKRKSVVER